MTDISQIVRWNANFVRGLAQSVLDRAKAIRTSLTPNQVPTAEAAATKVKRAGKRKTSTAKPTKKTRPAARSKRRTGKNG